MMRFTLAFASLGAIRSVLSGASGIASVRASGGALALPSGACGARFIVRGDVSRGRLALIALLFVAACCLSACKTVPTKAPTPSAPWEVRREALQQRDHFDLSGRIAVAAAQEGFNAKLRWQQQGSRSNLALDGPLGVGGVRITADGSTLNVVNSHGDPLDNDAARREIAARLGFEPPLQSLRYWVQGVPDPAHPADEVLDDQQRLTTLRQDGWQIDYAKYSAVAGQWLPSLITLKRDDVRVRLLVDGWGS
jgi:outer membrane lipoprotein LolB